MLALPQDTVDRRHVSWPIALLATLFVGAGVLHFVIPDTYAGTVPAWVPNAPLVVALSGVAMVLGGVGLLLRRTRAAAGAGLVLLLAAVFPANVEMLRHAHAVHASSLWQGTLWLRLPLQAALMWGVWRASHERPHADRSPRHASRRGA